MGFFVKKYLVCAGQRAVTGVLLLSIILGNFASVFTLVAPTAVHAAQSTIDDSAHATGDSHTHQAPQTVFVSDQVGYKFYRDTGGDCVYKKTSDAGGVWGSPVQVDSRTDCISIAVWYDQWTPNATSTQQYIHIVTMDTVNDDVYYNRLDTTGGIDTRLLTATPVSAVSGSGQGGTFALGSNYPAITKGTDGTIYIAVNDLTTGGGDHYVVECTTTCQTNTNWTETGTSPLDSSDVDMNILAPLANGDIMLINRDASADDIRSKIWNNSAWSATWVTIDPNAAENATYDVGMAVTVASSTSAATTTTFLAYLADVNDFSTQDHDIRTARYANGVWATSTTANATRDVVTNASGGLTNVAIGRDLNTGSIYVAYNRRTTIGTNTTGNTYWKYSTTSLASWSTESVALNSVAGDMYGVDLNLTSNQRMYVTWNDTNVLEDIYGDTIADLVPGVTVSTTSSQIAEVTAGTSDVYMGGMFVMNESISSRNVTDITIEESGTIDAQNALDNIKLFYRNDNTFPYDCGGVAYDGVNQFGSTDTNGFSGTDGSSSFTTGVAVTVSTTSALCIYPVMDVVDSAANNATINIRMANPSTNVVVTGGGEVGPSTALDITGSTTVKNDVMTQTHFHFRNDNGAENVATSRTGGTQDTVITAIQQSTPLRVRIGLSNEGGTTSPAMQYRLEYGLATSSCADIVSWTDVGATADAWDMYDSTHLTEGANTTNIATAIGGVTDENISFITANAGVKDISSQTAAITATSTQFFELEYSIIASTTATEGNTYCFRTTDAGSQLPAYLQYPRATIAADVAVSATSSQVTTVDIPSTNFYIGGAYVIVENSGSRTVDALTITENGTVDGTTGVSNIKLFYDLDTTAPYNCASESYAGTELRYGATSTAFSSANGTSTFNGTVTITTTQAMCVYTVLDITENARNGETLDITINQPTTDVVVSGGGSISPSATRDITGATTLNGAVLTQIRYHWRNDNGTEAGATSATGGSEGVALSTLSDGTPVRLRLEVSNEGATSSPGVQYRLEYGTKITTCSAIASWTNVEDGGGAWDMYDSTNLTDGTDTTDIAVGTGGVTNENTTFLTPNAAVKDTSSQTASTTLLSTQFLELEYSIEQTANAGYSVPYCFRVTKSGTEIDTYSVYPEVTTAPQRDFKVQRNVATLTGTSVTLTAGVDYIAPSASSSAFIRITNTHHTGAGNTAGSNTQDADNVTAYIVNPSNIMTSITIARAGTAVSNTRVYWEIVEFIGDAGTDNEMIVRDQQTVTFGGTATIATGTAVSTVTSDSDVVVFITGVMNPDAGAALYNAGLTTASWAAGTNEPVFERGETGPAIVVSYAVVEFAGANWQVQRASHTYTGTGAPETEDITSVNSLARTFLHTQKRVGSGLNGLDEFGHEVWLSSVGQISFQLESGATTPSGQTAVAWVIENIQTSTGAMTVTRSNGFSTGGAEPLTSFIEIGATTTEIANVSIFTNNRAADTGTNFPRPLLGITIASTTHYELWRSDTLTRVDYRTEVVEWPVAGLAFRQNDYRLYVDNNALDPTDPWGSPDIGENTPISASDQPPGDLDVVRIRMTVAVSNATLPTSTQAFTLQYAQRVTSCAAISSASWSDLGDSASSTAWRGYNATGTTDGTALSGNPVTPGDLNLPSTSDVAGTLEEENTSVPNPYSVADGQDVEYDWFAQSNGATAETTYCFRMVKADGTALDGYNDYPQIRTASFAPVTQNWRWYDDAENETPVTPLQDENVSPADVADQNQIKLRVTVQETKSVARDNARFKLQYSEHSNFSTSTDVVATSTCNASSTWCYSDGGGTDNAVISTTVLSDTDACSGGVGDGCGTHNESPTNLSGFRHEGGAATEYEFTLAPAAPRVNRTYYFRLYDLSQGLAVSAGDGESYPSLITEGSHLVLTTDGIATSTTIEGVTTDVATTPTRVAYGILPPDTQIEAAQQFTVTTNATEGYQTLMYTDSDFLSSNGEYIASVNASNTSPGGWATVCDAGARGCYGYHAGDDTLSGGSARFSPNDSYAGFETTPREVAYSSIPVTNDVVTIVYRVLARSLQPAGQYQTNVTFITLPSF